MSTEIHEEQNEERPYYVLTAKGPDRVTEEMITGSFEIEEVRQERVECRQDFGFEGYSCFRIHTIIGDSREAIHALLIGCNSDLPNATK